VRVGVKVVPNLAPFSFWSQGRWGNLLCDGWCRCPGTCSLEVLLCVGLGYAPATVRSSASLVVLGGCLIESPWVSFLRRPSEVFFHTSLVAHNHQNRCCVQPLGSCIGYHYNEVLELHVVFASFLYYSSLQKCWTSDLLNFAIFS
jgi:hypothetical protein